MVNEILPMKKGEYIIQKIMLGFIGAILSTTLTAFVCLQIPASNVLPLFIVIVLSAFLAALVGVFIGRFSNSLMVGIVYIKLVMILFLAPPILIYLVLPSENVGYFLSFLLPSSVTFYSLMDLVRGETQGIGLSIVILLSHCLVWSSLLFGIEKKTVFSIALT